MLRLALLATVIVAVGWLWVRSLGRALVTVDTSTRAAEQRLPEICQTAVRSKL